MSAWGIKLVQRCYHENATSLSKHEYSGVRKRYRGWRVSDGKLMRRYDEIYAIMKRKILYPGFYTRIGPSGIVRAGIEGKLLIRKELAETTKYLQSNDLRDMEEKLHAHIMPNLPPIKIKFRGFREENFKQLPFS